MGDTPMAFEAILRPLAYLLTAFMAAYIWHWAVVIAVGAYVLGSIRGKPQWLFAIGKLTAVLLISTIAVRLAFRDIGRYFVYVRYWAALFCLIGHLFPFTNRCRRVPGLLPAKVSYVLAAAVPVLSGLIYQDIIILLLSLLCGGLILWSTKGIKR